MEEKDEFRVYSYVDGEKEVQVPRAIDQELVRKAQKGDRAALGVLYSRYRRKILNYLYRFTGNRATAEELTQETFLKVVRYIHRYRPTGSVAGWIYKIARNLAMNALRDRPKITEVPLDEPVPTQEGEVSRAEVIPGNTPQPDEEVQRAETERRIQQSLLKISPVYREVVILCDIEGYPYKEASDILRCSINTIASRLARGRSQLGSLLGYLRKEDQR